MMAWITGSRSAKTFRRLYGKVKHLKDCTFYTDSWDAFSKVLPKVKHIIGKQHTAAIERDNSNIRNDLALFTRRTNSGRLFKLLISFLYSRNLSYLFLSENSQGQAGN